MIILTCALILDLWIGDPDWLWRRAPHPVVWIGKIISLWDTLRDHDLVVSLFPAEKDQRDFWWGCLLLVALGLISLIASRLVWMLAIISPLGAGLLEVGLVFVFLAQKSLSDHVFRVVESFRTGGLKEARSALSMIVGRDVNQLDESGVSRAAIESLSENYSDGVIAPILWYLLLGLPGILFYKAVNTADSMIGHRSEEYEYFGKPAARLDDWLNWPAARLTALLLVAVGSFPDIKKIRADFDVVVQDAPLHNSPNAGWPETAMAIQLGIQLGGPRIYAEGTVNASTLNAQGCADLTVKDIEGALSLYRRTCFAVLGLVVFLALLQS